MLFFEGLGAFFWGAIDFSIIIIIIILIIIIISSSSSSSSSNSTSSTAQGGGGSFKNRKRIGEIDCCEWRMSEQKNWPTD